MPNIYRSRCTSPAPLDATTFNQAYDMAEEQARDYILDLIENDMWHSDYELDTEAWEEVAQYADQPGCIT